MLTVNSIGLKRGNHNILQNINFQVDVGEFLVLVGPNGAGKSSLLNLVSGATLPTKGSIELNNQVIQSISADWLAKHRAVLTQKNSVSTPLTNREIALMGRYPHFKSNPTITDFNLVDNCMQRTNTKQYSNRLYQHLSGGEQQRVQFTRALCQVDFGGPQSRPKLLLLDEPLNNLDIKYQHELLAIAKEFVQRGNTVIAVLHDLNLTAQYASKVAMLKQGELLAFGTTQHTLTSELLTHCFDYPIYTSNHPSKNHPLVLY